MGGTSCWSSRTLLQNQFLSIVSIAHGSTWQNKLAIDPTWWHLHEMIFRWSKVYVVYSQSQPHLRPVPLECETGNSEHPHLANSFHLVPVPDVPLRKSSSSGDSWIGSNRREAHCNEGFFSEQKPEDAYVSHVQICVCVCAHSCVHAHLCVCVYAHV